MGENENTSEIIEKPNSCEISVSAKGEVSFKVKAYGEDLDGACAEALASYNRMRDILAADKQGAADKKAAA